MNDAELMDKITDNSAADLVRGGALKRVIAMTDPKALASIIKTAVHNSMHDYYAEKTKLRPADEYHEDMGVVLWHRVPPQEPPYVGTTNDCNWYESFAPGEPSPAEFYTHFQLLPELNIDE